MFHQDGFSVSWCDPNDQPQCAKTWDRDITEDEHSSPDIGQYIKKSFNLVRSGLIWIDLDWSGLIWIDLDWSGLIWIDLDWSGFIWIDLDWSGLIWIDLDLILQKRSTIIAAHGKQFWYMGGGGRVAQIFLPKSLGVTLGYKSSGVGEGSMPGWGVLISPCKKSFYSNFNRIVV